MKTEKFEEYIGQLLNTPEVDKKILDEIPQVGRILAAYRYGLLEEELPIDIIMYDFSVVEKIPPQFHVLVAQAAILKSKVASAPVMNYLIENVSSYLVDFKHYFTKRL